MKKVISKKTKVLGIFIAILFLIGVGILIYSSVLRGIATETKVSEIDGETIVIRDGKDVYTVRQPRYTKYEAKDKIFIKEKNGKAKLLPNPNFLEILSFILMVGPFLLCAIIIIIKNLILNIRFMDSKIFKAIGFITIVYAISVGFILLAIGSFYGPVNMLVVNYAIAAYIILIGFVIYITGDNFKKSKK